MMYLMHIYELIADESVLIPTRKYFISVWPKLDMKTSKRIQFSFATFHLVRNSIYILCIYFEYYRYRREGDQFTLWDNLGMASTYLMYCGALVLCGITSYVLGFIQIFKPI